MTGERAATGWWSAIPPQVSYLIDTDPELLDIALDPLPSGAPAVVQFRPAVGGGLGDQVTVLLDNLDRVATELFPRWLPGAERLESSLLLGVPAVRELATRLATRSPNFGPFLADLAERALTGYPAGHGRFPAEVRAAGLARVIASAYDRDSAALLIRLPDGLTPADEQTLVTAAEWLAHHGRFAVWLAGAPLVAVDRVRSVRIELPRAIRDLVAEAKPYDESSHESHAAPVLTYPPLSGSPRRDSPSEQALERALNPHEWAHGRRWNHNYEWNILYRTYRLDLFWPAEGLVVEIDGPDHRGAKKFADDRRRDVQLQLLGNDVLRFTDEQVLADVHTVVLKIKQLLTKRRADGVPNPETRQHVKQ